MDTQQEDTQQEEAEVFVQNGVLFVVDQAKDGKFVADIALTRGVVEPQNVEAWARVVGRFNSRGEAITAAKSEIRALTES